MTEVTTAFGYTIGERIQFKLEPEIKCMVTGLCIGASNSPRVEVVYFKESERKVVWCDVCELERSPKKGRVGFGAVAPDRTLPGPEAQTKEAGNEVGN